MVLQGFYPSTFHHVYETLNFTSRQERKRLGHVIVFGKSGEVRVREVLKRSSSKIGSFRSRIDYPHFLAPDAVHLRDIGHLPSLS